jgi:hypothetical protein
MPTIQELLDESQRLCGDLAKEINEFKETRSLHQRTAESLNATCAALDRTADAIRPFTASDVSRIRTLVVCVAGGAVLNLVLSVVILVRSF